MNVGLSLLTLLPGQVGGSETYVHGLLGAFRDGHGPERTTVLVTDRVRQRCGAATGGRVSLQAIRRFRYRSGTAWRGLAIGAGLLAGERLGGGVLAELDVVHYPLTIPLPRCRRPSVITYHDAQHLEHPEFSSRAERAFRALAYDDAARRASVVVTPSDFTRRAVIERLGIASARVHASHSGIDHERFHPSSGRNDASALAGLRLPRRYVIYPGNLWPHKNHLRLLEAMRHLDDAVGLVLTGRDYGKVEGLMSAAARIGVASRVRHLGYVDADLLPALYRAAAAIVFPSLYEGFGSPPLEAMACGCPAAVARSGSLPEVCGAGAMYFDPKSPRSIAEAVGPLLDDDSLRQSLRNAGLRQAARFTWAASAARHLAAYTHAARTAPPGAGLPASRRSLR